MVIAGIFFEISFSRNVAAMVLTGRTMEYLSIATEAKAAMREQTSRIKERVDMAEKDDCMAAARAGVAFAAERASLQAVMAHQQRPNIRMVINEKTMIHARIFRVSDVSRVCSIGA